MQGRHNITCVKFIKLKNDLSHMVVKICLQSEFGVDHFQAQGVEFKVLKCCSIKNLRKYLTLGGSLTV